MTTKRKGDHAGESWRVAYCYRKIKRGIPSFATAILIKPS